jgi:putative DNA primase/helicase
MSGILEVVGVSGFMANSGELTEHNSDDDAIWSAFVAAWWSRFGTTPVLANELWVMVEEKGLLEGVVDVGEAPASKVVKLGKQLRKLRDRYFGGVKVAWAGKAPNGSQRLRLEVGPDAENPETPEG